MKNLPNSKFLVFSIAALLAALPAVSQAQTVTFDNEGGDFVWGNPVNWDTNTLPTAGDDVNLGNFTVNVNAPGATYDVPVSSTGATININNGGVLTPGTNTFNSIRNIGAINVNNEGTLQAGALINRSDITVATGGLLAGLGGLQDTGSTLVLTGGVWEPGPTSGTPKNILLRQASSVDIGTGTLRLDLFSATDFERFELRDSPTLNLSTGTIELVSSYNLMEGDTFSFVFFNPTDAVSPVVTYGDGSNVVLTGMTNGLTLNTSNWATNGTVTVVPEPGSILLLAAGAFSTLLVRRRR